MSSIPAVSNTIPARLVVVMAVCCALAVSAIYYHQPLLPLMAASFGLTPTQAGLIATLTQLGYGIGLLLIVPLADCRQPRSLALWAIGANTVALLACAAAPSFALLCASSFLVGVTAVTAQLIIPALSGLAATAERGRVVGTLLSGLSAGLLLARTVGGVVGEHAGWRAVFLMASLVDGLLLVIVAKNLPAMPRVASIRYGELMRSLGSLLREERVLRFSAASGFLIFAAFSSLWATLAALLTQPPYRFGSTTIGLFGLVTVLGIVASPRIGAWADRLGARTVALAGAIVLAVGFACIAAGGRSLGWLIIGMVLLDLGNRTGLVANQARIHTLRPEARSRLNTVFMGSYFLGGAVGAALGNYGVHRAGWLGLAAVGALLALAATTISALSPRDSRVTLMDASAIRKQG
ncbi:putative MFS family arabinose efflux permease [Pseudomonas brassicacearum]|uniref:MFS family arabinose efflux permease n=1 Tax=Pseudomonas brassicacearum TaxID=930166 RepID=A0AAW8M752_9PSED|nr:MFS transporter [Pseudomonas brassicacearum]MDR6957847.1 putative MFS family arabinose efflux permease [Pseudomonas brassicacearum]